MSDEQLMLVSNEEQFITNYKSVYTAMTAKSDCRSKVFPSDVIITIQDVYNLNQMVTQKFKAHYNDAGFSINVVVDFHRKESLEFSTWTEFENYSFFDSEYIESVIIKWEYNAKLPQYRVPQKHTLVVKLTNGLKPEEMLNLVFAGNLENVRMLEAEACPVVARVDFINSLLGDELLAIVEKWHHTLEKPIDQRNKALRFLAKNKRKVAYLLSYIAIAFISVCGVTTVISYMTKRLEIEYLGNINMEQFGKLLYIILFVVMGCILAYKFAEFLSNICYNMLVRDERRHVFAISRGDNNRQKEIEQDYQANMVKFVISAIVSIMMDILYSIVIDKLI